MLLFLISSSIAASTVQSPSSAQPIIVIGQRIKTAEAALKACLAKRCPTDEDIDVTLALAETQIIAGKYRDARKTLLSSLGRNKGEAKRYPIPVSDLYRANGRVAAHLGYDNDYYSSTWGIYRTLKNGLPSAEYRHFSALLEVAEMMGRTRGHERARIYYESVAKQARKANRPDIAAIAELRSFLRHYPPGDIRDKGIQRIVNSKDPRMRAAVLEGKLMLARIAYEKNDMKEAEAIQKDFSRLDLKRPVLIYAPSFEMVERELTSGGDIAVKLAIAGGTGISITRNLPYAQWSSTKRLAGDFDDMWVDVGFRITPDGKVADAEVLRKRGDIFWTEPLLASIRGRRYTPGKNGDPASTRVERYTYTSAYEYQTGTRLAERSPSARVEYFDLSPMGIAKPN